MIWEVHVETNMKVLAIESSTPVETPERYRNKFGQLLEHSPFSERDITTPTFVGPVKDRSTDVQVRLKMVSKHLSISTIRLILLGDGFFFPYTFNINDFMPITGKIHQPPPVHQTFQSKGFVICSFVPRLFDYHPRQYQRHMRTATLIQMKSYTMLRENS